MRYLILQPKTPTDPRAGYSSLEHLHEQLPVVMEADAEFQAANLCRLEHPDCIAMPVPVTIGSGEIVLLGILPSIRAPHRADSDIPFVMFVQAIPENDYDRKLIKKKPSQFSPQPWRAPVMRPSASARTAVHKVELRATDLDQPTMIDALCGIGRDGRLVITCELNGVAMSLAFNDIHVNLVSEAHETVVSDGPSNFDIVT